MKHKNIIFVTDYLPSGGTHTFLTEFIKACHSIGIKIELVLFFHVNQAYQGEWNHFLTPYCIPLRRVGIFSVFERYQSLKKLKLIKKKTVIISDLFVPSLVSLFFFCRLFYIFHGKDSLEKRSRNTSKASRKKISILISQIVELVVLNSAEKIIVLSNYAKSLLQEIDQKKIIVIHPGINNLSLITKLLLKPKTFFRKKYKLPSKSKLLVLSGRIEPRKGFLPFFTELAKQSTASNIHVVFLSHFSQSEILNEFFSSIDPLKQNITLINNPSRETYLEYVRCSSVYVLPSVDLETYGFVSQEALMLGVPVIAFKHVGANKEIIPNEYMLNTFSFKELVNKALETEESTYSSTTSKIYKTSWEDFVKKLIKQTSQSKKA